MIDWYDQQRARGICYICWRSMADDDPRRRHSECAREVTLGKKWAEVRAHPPPLLAHLVTQWVRKRPA
jgi:hypothetical protein